MKRVIVLACVLLCSYGCATAEVSISSAQTTKGTQEVQTSTGPDLSSIIGDILSHPDQYSDQEVNIVGYFRGWDLLHEIQKGPPVSRSDWVITDSRGAIYVTGQTPEGLNPSSPDAVWTVSRLSAHVEYDEQKAIVYLRADTVELISK